MSGVGTAGGHRRRRARPVPCDVTGWAGQPRCPAVPSAAIREPYPGSGLPRSHRQPHTGPASLISAKVKRKGVPGLSGPGTPQGPTEGGRLGWAQTGPGCTPHAEQSPGLKGSLDPKRSSQPQRKKRCIRPGQTQAPPTTWCPRPGQIQALPTNSHAQARPRLRPPSGAYLGQTQAPPTTSRQTQAQPNKQPCPG